MYIEHWDAFYEQAVALYRANPLKTRFVTKYRHCDGKLTLKVTDGPTVSGTGSSRTEEAQAVEGRAGRQRGRQSRTAV